jgi:hypothetical protein
VGLFNCHYFSATYCWPNMCVKWSGQFELPGHKYDSRGVLTWPNMCVADGS